MAQSIRSEPVFADINITPFIGVLLVLLAVFMTATPTPKSARPIDSPPMDYFGDYPSRDPVYVTLLDTGALFVVDRPSTLNTLTADVCAAIGGDDCRQTDVFVRAQPDATYNDFMAAMNALEAAGFKRVGMLNEDIT